MELINAHFLDRFSPGALFLLTIGLMWVFIELGFRIGARPQASRAKAQHSQVRAIMGAALGLTAFMLAFTFATAQTHYETRVQAMLEETRLANDAFLQAEFLPEPHRGEARDLLRRYMGDRLHLHQLSSEGQVREVAPLLERAEAQQQALWRLATEQARSESDPDASWRQRDPFTESVIGLMDMHSARMEAALLNRIPYVIWVILYLTGALSMLIMGYQAGLVGRRSPVATVSLAVAFAAVLMLITDLDRPVMTLFDIDNRVVVETVARMDRILAGQDAD